MKAVLRAGAVFMAAAFAPTLALAQTAPRSTPTPPPTSNSTTPVAVGPSELQNFSLKGTVERQADQPTAVTPSRPQTAPVRPPAVASSPPRQPQGRNTERIAPPPGAAPQQVGSAAPQVNTAPAATQAPPIFQQPPATAPTPTPESLRAPAQSWGFFSEFPLWPWIAAAIALLGGAAILLWRRRQQQPLPAGAQFDLLVGQAPEPEPVVRKPEPVRPPPRPATPPQPEPEPKAPPPFSWRPSPTPGGEVTRHPEPPRDEPVRSAGIVASKLRPALELGFHPLRCEVNDDQVAIEFELELFNAGAAPARAVFAEASLLNASATQDAELQAFFSNAHSRGEPLDVIPPLKRVSFKSQVVAPRTSVQEYELAGRKTFVPVIAFNALYEWSGGKAQSSAAYLVGRDTQQDKLGPLRLDQGAREFSGLGARPLPSGVRT
jgi:hypothetical protein